MSDYTASYTDEKGRTKQASLTPEVSALALKNDYEEVLRRYNPKYVTIHRMRAKAGEAAHLRVTVNAPSHYLTAISDTTPKACDSMDVDIICYMGYPLKPVKAFYAPDHYLASPNVFRSGLACIDTWVPFTSSLVSVVDKLVHDIIHDPCVSRYDSVANHEMVRWHKDGVAAGRFPTIAPRLLNAPQQTALPPRRTPDKPAAAPPSLPARRR